MHDICASTEQGQGGGEWGGKGIGGMGHLVAVGDRLAGGSSQTLDIQYGIVQPLKSTAQSQPLLLQLPSLPDLHLAPRLSSYQASEDMNSACFIPS